MAWLFDLDIIIPFLIGIIVGMALAVLIIAYHDIRYARKLKKERHEQERMASQWMKDNFPDDGGQVCDTDPESYFYE